MIKVTYDAGRVSMTISGNGIVLLTEAECITLVLYDKLKEAMGEDIANRYAKKSIEMLHNCMRGLDFDGKPFCSAAEQKPEMPDKPDLDALRTKLSASLDVLNSIARFKETVNTENKGEE